MFIRTIINFLSKEECNSIINQYSQKNLQVAKIGEELNDTELFKIRKSSILFVELPTIKEKLENLLKSQIKIKGFELDTIEKFQFTKYDINNHYDWHTDMGKSFNDRFCSIVIQLNDEYEGGELIYKDFKQKEITFEKGVGNLFIFKSSIEHKVNVVTSGVRYSLVSWIKLKPIDGNKKSLL